MSISSILLIGGGNMGAALAASWRAMLPDAALLIAETNAERRAQLRDDGFDAPDELDVPEAGFDIVVLAVKPQTFPQLAPQLPGIVGEATLVSIMAGVTLAALKEISPHAARAMPNTPASIGEGMSAVCAPELVKDRLNDVVALFAAAGDVLVVGDEAQMHAVTAISGSGPAYVFAFMEALEAAAQKLGLDEASARALVLQTVRGAALLADASDDDAATLRRKVTSPGGTTEAALKKLTEGQFEQLIFEAAHASQSRSKSLS